MAKGFDFIEMVIDAPIDQRAGMLAQAASMFGKPVADLEAELANRLVAGKAKREAAERKTVNAKRNAAIEAITATVESIRGDTEALRTAHEAVGVLEGAIVLSGFDGDTLTFTVTGLKVSKRGGGTGGGKPAANQPRPFVDSVGDRIFGQLTVWAEDNVGLDTLADLSAEHDVELSFSEKTDKLTSKNLVKLLKAAGEITDSEVTADETETFEASRS